MRDYRDLPPPLGPDDYALAAVGMSLGLILILCTLWLQGDYPTVAVLLGALGCLALSTILGLSGGYVTVRFLNWHRQRKAEKLRQRKLSERFNSVAHDGNTIPIPGWHDT